MCMTPQELQNLSDLDLIENFQKAIELDVKNSGNGKNPFDKEQLKQALTERLSKKKVHIKEEREVGDGHDEFS